MNALNEKVVDCCPMGHRIRGPLSMRGRWVNCPKCDAGFEFGSASNQARELAKAAVPTETRVEPTVAVSVTPAPTSVSDTGVMRIIGDWTPPPNLADKFAAEARAAIERAKAGEVKDASEVVLTNDGEDIRATAAAIRASFAITQPVADVMRPISQAVYLDARDSMRDIADVMNRTGHQWYPVRNATQDRIIGVVHASDVRRIAGAGMTFDLRSVMQLPVRFQGSLTTDRLKDKFQNKPAFFALIVNESGETVGFVTDRDCKSESAAAPSHPIQVSTDVATTTQAV